MSGLDPHGAGALARIRTGATRTVRACVAAVEWAAFWVAALLPVAALPLYAALQYAVLDPAVVAGAAAVNLLALVVGHGHDPGWAGRDRSPGATDE